MVDKVFNRRKEDAYQPRILSDEEIEMYLKGDRREVDKLILFSINRLAACLIPHAEREEDREEAQDRLLKSLGGVEMMVKRAKFVDASIAAVESRTRMMDKVTASSASWIVIVFLGFLAVSTWDSIVHALKAKLGG